MEVLTELVRSGSSQSLSTTASNSSALAAPFSSPSSPPSPCTCLTASFCSSFAVSVAKPAANTRCSASISRIQFCTSGGRLAKAGGADEEAAGGADGEAVSAPLRLPRGTPISRPDVAETQAATEEALSLTGVCVTRRSAGRGPAAVSPIFEVKRVLISSR